MPQFLKKVFRKLRVTLRWTSLISTAGFAVVSYILGVTEQINILGNHNVKVAHKLFQTLEHINVYL